MSKICACGETKYNHRDPKCEHCMAMDQCEHCFTTNATHEAGCPNFPGADVVDPTILIALDQQAREAFWNGSLPDDYVAKPTDACFRCGNRLGTVVVALAGWVCTQCESEISSDAT